MKRWTTTAIVLALCLAVACDRSSEEEVRSPEPVLEVEPPRVESPEVADEDVDEIADEVEPEAVDFIAWPSSGEQWTFELMWLGGDEEIELRDRPRLDASGVGMVSWMDGDQVEWMETRIHVDRPRLYFVEESITLTGTPYDTEFLELEATERQVEFQAGERVYFYQYAGENRCFIGVGGEILYTGCDLLQFLTGHDDLEWENEDYFRPYSQQWWVKVDQASVQGWMLVDEAAVDVHERRIEGYEDFNEPEDDEPFSEQ